jgi:nucleotide-binding universal stress UspA family protein
VQIETILVPHDFSPTADRALELARALAHKFGAKKIVLCHAHFVPLEIGALAVRGVERVYAEIEDQACAKLKEMVGALEAEGFSAHFEADEGAAENLILRVAKDTGADLIIMGTHGRRGLGHAFLGSIAERTLRIATCPVITVPPPA